MPTNDFGQPIGEPVEWEPRPPIAPVTLTGRTCIVEPLGEQHVGGLHEALVERSSAKVWTYMVHGPFADKPSFTVYMGELIASPTLVPLVVLDAGGTPLGVLTYLRIDPAHGSAEVGHVALGDRLQRTTIATEAQYLLMRHVFDDLGYRRYEWKCDSLNEPSRNAAARLGFTYEGRFAQALVYKGRNRDTDWFAISDLEWPGIKAAFEAWLDPSNFDEEGRQLSKLSTPRTERR